ncbi:Gfo/Idh/MocA family oxidoreductase [Nocardioides sp. zg-ZUI104]|uniref:Gfo/Idh/MocA family protein n=1 Tax=Nocardioides faecalis TaxID=2803858 RepID=UPI001BCC954C|nr:Gfo/Idh/MocA family oxidoreductase [Nocardioides faecalis]MBS4753769.1 Gfo/Idh/MocA family oxidoreductase [Nocardioides faecalis]
MGAPTNGTAAPPPVPGSAVRWGIVGPGHIAGVFAQGLRLARGGTLHAVASRDPARAAAFAAEHGAARRHGSYDDLIADPEVDAVYVATPHAHHAAPTVAALRAGKPVLCEKPLGIDPATTEQMLAASADSGTFLMEALWSRFLPAYVALRDELAAHTIGRPEHVEAELGFRASYDAGHRLFDPALGGGATLDIGVYPLQLAMLVLGPVEDVTASGSLAPTGVDASVVAELRHAGGTTSRVVASLTEDLPGTAQVLGTHGRLELPGPMYAPQALRVLTTAASPDGPEIVSDTTLAAPFEGGMQFQVEHVHACLAQGLRESPVMPHAVTRHLASVMAQVRRQLGAV